MKKEQPPEDFDFWDAPTAPEPGFWRSTGESGPTSLYHQGSPEEAFGEDRPTTVTPRSEPETLLPPPRARGGASPTAVPAAPPPPPPGFEGLTPALQRSSRDPDALTPDAIAPGAETIDSSLRPPPLLGGDGPALSFSERPLDGAAGPALVSPPPIPEALRARALRAPADGSMASAPGGGLPAPEEQTLRPPVFEYTPREVPARLPWWRRLLRWLGLSR